jgi:serine/threonine protein phosphatase PrpC
VTGAYQIGKHPDSCEDAFFISDRGFGVADGVSGWNDYGFSSSLFSNQLMSFCNEEIKTYIIEEKNTQKSKKSFSKLKKSASYLSMENLDLNDEEQSSEEEKVEEL